MSNILTFRWSASSVAALFAVAVLLAAYFGDGLPEELLGFAILIGLPVAGVVTILLSIVNVARWRSLQSVLELIVGLAALVSFYWNVIRTPI